MTNERSLSEMKVDLQKLIPVMDALSQRDVLPEMFFNIGTDAAIADEVATLLKKKAAMKPISMRLAKQILGHNNVLTAGQVRRVWGIDTDKPEEQIEIHYCEETLRRCAEKNSGQGGDKWMLVYVIGLGFSEMLYLRNNKKSNVALNPPTFDSSFESVYDMREPYPQYSAGRYVLINRRPFFYDQPFAKQQLGLIQLGQQFRRCPGPEFVEISLSLLMLHGDTFLYPHWFHLSPISRNSPSGQEHFMTFGFYQYENSDNKNRMGAFTVDGDKVKAQYSTICTVVILEPDF